MSVPLVLVSVLLGLLSGVNCETGNACDEDIVTKCSPADLEIEQSFHQFSNTSMFCSTMETLGACLRRELASAGDCTLKETYTDIYINLPNFVCNQSRRLVEQHAECIQNDKFETEHERCAQLHNSSDSDSADDQCRDARDIWWCYKKMTCDEPLLNDFLANFYSLLVQSSLKAEHNCTLVDKKYYQNRTYTCRVSCSAAGHSSQTMSFEVRVAAVVTWSALVLSTVQFWS